MFERPVTRLTLEETVNTSERQVEGTIRTRGELGLREATFSLTAIPAQPLHPTLERWVCEVVFLRDLRGRPRTWTARFNFSAPREDWNKLAQKEVRIAGVTWDLLGQGTMNAEFPEWNDKS